MKLALLAIFVSALLLFGCASQGQPPQNGNPQVMPGSDRDAHGCIPSAGYQWCEPLNECIRPWETNCTASASPSAPATPSEPIVGNDRDSHGCIPSAGYEWCDASQKCIRPWEENCTAVTAPSEQMVGNDSDAHGCKGSAGYSWCPELSKCVRVWEEDCPSLREKALSEQAKTYCSNETEVFLCGQYIKVVSSMPGAGSKFYELGQYDPITCTIVSPDYMTPQCRLLLLGNNCVEQKVC